MQEAKAEVEKWQRKYREVDDYAAEIHLKVTKQWEEELEKQLAIKMKEESGKLEAAKRKQEKKTGAKGKEKGAKEKEEQRKGDAVSKDASLTSSSEGKKKDDTKATSPVTKSQIPRKTPVDQTPSIIYRRSTKPTGDFFSSFF